MNRDEKAVAADLFVSLAREIAGTKQSKLFTTADLSDERRQQLVEGRCSILSDNIDRESLLSDS